LADGVHWTDMHHRAKLVKIGQAFCDITFFRFLRATAYML